MTLEGRLAADYRGTGITLGTHPMALHRRQLASLGVSPAAALIALPHGKWVRIAGHVIVRQRPGTAKGFFFLTLEDETGIANAIVTPGLFQQQRSMLVSACCLVIEGRLQNVEGVVSVKAQRIRPWGEGQAGPPSHDFH